MYKAITNASKVNFPKFAENSVKLWEYYSVAQSHIKTPGRHRRRYAFLPQPYFLNGLGPWNLTPGARYSVQVSYGNQLTFLCLYSIKFQILYS